MQQKSDIQYIGLTDMGKSRTNNEDLWLCQKIWNESCIVAAVIDGVGGYEGGEVAAKIAAEELLSYLRRYPNGERSQILKEAMVYANNCIYRERVQKMEYGSMGCVMTAVLIEPEQGTVDMAHIGDTRLYELSEGELTKLSHDHSPVGRYEEWGVLSEKEAMEHPMRNVIERDLGHRLLENSVENYIEMEQFFLKGNATWLLCSDGLTDLVPGTQIRDILLSDESLDNQAKQLVDAANDAGGKDNITVVLIRTQEGDSFDETKNQIDVVAKDELVVKMESLENRLQVENFKTKGKKFEIGIKRLGCIVVLFVWGVLVGWFTHLFYLDSQEEIRYNFPFVPAITEPDVYTDSIQTLKDTVLGMELKNVLSEELCDTINSDRYKMN